MTVKQGNTGVQVTLDWDKPVHIDTSRAAQVTVVNGDGTVRLVTWGTSTTPSTADNIQAVDVGGTPPAGSEGHTVVYFQKND